MALVGEIEAEFKIYIENIFALPKFRYVERDFAKEDGGIYFLFDHNWFTKKYDLLYIGQSKNIRYRLYQHMNVVKTHHGNSNHKFMYFSYIVCNKQHMRLILEIAYIWWYRPSLNKQLA